jgi:hypothetical protein
VDSGLAKTASLWPDVRAGFALVHRAADILRNREERDGRTVRRKYQKHLREMKKKAKRPGALRSAIDHFLKVSKSYSPGLFHCYDVPDLPRTNNQLEQLFGSTRHHERRCTGRKAASPSLVLRGSVRVVAALGTRQRTHSGEELAPVNMENWRSLRSSLEQRRCVRVLRCRFRRDPEKYLKQLEAILLQSALPS